MIAIIDYGLGNVKAFANIYNQLNIPHTIATDPTQLARASHLILPGVGAFDQAMQRLSQSGVRETLDELVLDKKLPVLGVCVGMQILAGSSEEGKERGLNWIDAEVVRFHAAEAQIFVPHMGWNNVRPLSSDGLFRGLDEQSRFYFLHSYLVRCRRSQDVLAVTDYGGEFACAVHRDNIYGVQFHPEKSHGYGVRLLKNFAEL